jgi:lysyl-tRNA synthetase class 2
MSSQDEQIAQRQSNLRQLAELGVEIYPHRFDRRHTVSELVAAHGSKTHDELEAERPETVTSGRILAIRSFGKANFLAISDGGTRIQIFRQDSLPPLDFQIFKLLDFGDWIGVEGRLFRTKTNELTIWASRLHFLAKCQLPLPEKWHGLTDVEIRYRQRYLDLIVNPDARKVFEVRSRVVSAIRSFMTARGYLEVETPMMQPIAGGALARPFVTHHNTLDMDLYLRVAPELYLKRLVVGGLEKVFEINRNFRNEGISTQHNPEFTMLEFYTAYADARDQMALTEELFAGAAREILGTTELAWGDETISLKAPFRRVSMVDAILENISASEEEKIPSNGPTQAGDRTRVTRETLGDLHLLRKIAHEAGVENVARFGESKGKLLAEIFGAVAERRLLQPTYIVDYPAEISPLSKTKPGDPSTADRFELFIGRMEVANGFCELNDPDEQAEKFRAQVAERTRGDEEAMAYDEDYVEALAYGMPPTAGEGVGIDRLAMLFTNSHSIRDVILFPLMRPKKEDA